MVEHALAPPAAKIRHIDLGVSDEMQFRLVDDPLTSGLPALIPSGQDGLTTHSVADVGEGMIEAEYRDSLR
ncbi:hypothetical protein [Thiocapsa sp. UBA6158]|jgi:hypothetical protein|uniref:hypothetical protein n=1 Tax=Thiocapsa sp. UBA6158 TaxID=1947692 RepID=UPI0025F627FA|nr:hypothetical protein [Thiocapsa sp. UBA6158]